MKHRTHAAHMPIWVLCAATIFSGGACIETFGKRNKPIDPPKNVYTPAIIKPEVEATSAADYSQTGPIKPEPIPEWIYSQYLEQIRLSCQERLLSKLRNSNRFTREAKDQMKRYIEAFDAWSEEMRQAALYDSVYDDDYDAILSWLYDQYLEQTHLGRSVQQCTANASRWPTKASLLDALHDDKVFNKEEKNSIEYYISNLTIGNTATYDQEELDAIAIRQLCGACRSTNHQDILRWIDQQIKQQAQIKENEKRRIEAKIQEIMQQTEAKEETCVICYGKDKLYSLRCSHYFHQDCITEWVANTPSCPMCRQPIADLN